MTSAPKAAWRALLILALAPPLASGAPPATSPRLKVIADQDSAGPEGTNFLSLLMLLNAPQVELLGITTVSGDQWVEPATVFALHAVELTGRTDVPVIKGAERPLLNSAREQELREALYGSHPTWHGAFNPDAPAPERTWPPPGGSPKTLPRPGRAADFLIDTIRAHPHEVALYFAGPLTNLALAVSMDPGIVPLTKTLYVMGASSAGGPELNWWWDPEAAAIDLDVDITHGPKYGHTVVWTPPACVPTFFLAYSGPDGVDPAKWQGHLAPPAHLHPATVHLEVDVPKFEEIFVELMSR